MLALECILSSLASDEAARTSALSRRWRRVCAAVPVVDLVDPKKGKRDDSSDKPIPVCFNQNVTGAILSKAPQTPIRTLCLDALHPPHDLLDQWIVAAVSSGAEEIDVKLRYWHDSERSPCPFGSSSEDLDKRETSRYVKTHHRLFGCSTLRRLRLMNWTLDLPQGGIIVSSLKTLCLASREDSGPKRVAPAAAFQLPKPCQPNAAGVPERQGDLREKHPPAEFLHDLLPPCQVRQAAQLMPAVAALQRWPS
jgi:hypothetical protein